MARVAVSSLLVVALVGCSSDAAPAVDGGAVDAGQQEIDFEIPWLAGGLPPVTLTPCPDGWREIAATGEEPATCDPYPEGGRLDCPQGQAHFAGERGCAPVGQTCPAGDFAGGLPTDRRVVYVRPGASMGDGTEASPYGSLSEFSLGSLAMGAVIALSRGRHAGQIRVARGHVLQGACAAMTQVTMDVPHARDGVITFVGIGGEVRDLAVADSPRAGIWIHSPGVDALVDGVEVADNQVMGVSVGDGVRLTARSLLVRDTEALSSTGIVGRGLSLQFDADAELERAVIVRNHDAGVYVAENGASITASDLVVEDTLAQPSDGFFGTGVSVQLGATADVTRALLDRNREVAAIANRNGAALTMTDVVVRDTASSGDGRFGRGLVAQADASVDASRTVITRNRDVGVFAAGAGVTLTVSDVLVRDTRAQPDGGGGGRALSIQEGANTTIDRTMATRSSDITAHFSAGATTMTDVLVADGNAGELLGSRGRGISAQDGIDLALSRVALIRNRDVGLAALMGALVVANDVVVRDTLERGCADTTCGEAGGGHGVGSYGTGTHLRMTGFSVSGSALCGVHLALSAEIDLSLGEVRAQPIGVCAQVDGYDTDRLTTGVRYHDNGVNLQSTSLPVPDAAAPLSPIGS